MLKTLLFTEKWLCLFFRQVSFRDLSFCVSSLPALPVLRLFLSFNFVRGSMSNGHKLSTVHLHTQIFHLDNKRKVALSMHLLPFTPFPRHVCATRICFSFPLLYGTARADAWLAGKRTGADGPPVLSCDTLAVALSVQLMQPTHPRIFTFS